MDKNRLELLEKDNVAVSEIVNRGERTAFMFPGHGAQYPNMLRGLFENNKVVKEIFDKADDIYLKLEKKKLTSCIFYTKQEEELTVQELLAEPRVMQPAIFVCNMALFYLLEAEGLHSDCYVGHSLGEISALCAAKVYDFETGFQIAYFRGKTAEIIPPESRGGMLAVSAGYTEELASELLKGNDNCQVSIVNSKKHFNISGDLIGLKNIKERCEKKGLTANMLNVTHAFHSKIMQPAVIPYKEAIQAFKFKKPEKTVFSTILGRIYKDSDFQQENMVDILSGQLLTPFNFRDILLEMREGMGIRYFIEVGPNNMLTKLARATLTDACVIATNDRKKDSVETYYFFKAAYFINGLGKEKNVSKDQTTVIKRIISKITMYPMKVIEFSDSPFFIDLAVTEQIFDKIVKALENKYEILRGKITKKTSLNEIDQQVNREPGEKKKWMSENLQVKEEIKKGISKITMYPRSIIDMNDQPYYKDLALSDKVFENIRDYFVAEYGIRRDFITKNTSLNEICNLILGTFEKTDADTIHPENIEKDRAKETDSFEEQPVFIEKEEIKKFVLDIVQEKTGYPLEFLEDELDFEADLGIDSVKQGEIFSKVLEKYQGVKEQNETIKDYNTISKVVDFIYGKIANQKNTVKKEKQPAQEEQPESYKVSSKSEIKTFVLDVVQEKTGYPAEILEEDLDLEADLGIDSVKQADIFGKIREEFGYGVQDGENIKEFNTISKIIDYTADKLIKPDEVYTEMKPQSSSAPDQELSRSLIKKEILLIICKKTGYPEEILEENLDLEADLGIDSVKQGEIFSMLGEKFSNLGDSREDAKDYNTIAKIIDYVMEKETSQKKDGTDRNNHQGNHESQKKQAPKIPEFKAERICRRFVTVTVEAPFDESVGKNYRFFEKQVLLISDMLDGEITKELGRELRSRGAFVVYLTDNDYLDGIENVYKTDFYDDHHLQDTLEQIVNDHKKIESIVNCRSLSDPIEVEEVNEEEWERFVLTNYNAALYTAKAVYEYFELNKEGTAYFALTNIGGCLGYENSETGFNPIGAVTAGFVKGFEKELRPFNCKVIDFTNIRNSKFVVQKAIQEMSLIEDAVEICYDNENIRKRPYVIEKEIENKEAAMDINSEDVIFVTGGSRGIVHEFIDALSESCNPSIIFTGRTKRAKGDEKWLHMSEAEFAEYKAAFMIEEKRKRPEASILEVNSSYNDMKNSRELEDNLKQFEKKGYQVEYLECNASDINSIQHAVQNVIQKYGRITGVINGAGLPALEKIPKKSPVRSREVVRVKANSFYALENACKSQKLKFFISIGSISGRFGMDGQVEYSAGADLIVRLSCINQQLNENCKFTTLGWSAWDEVGMATNETVKKIQQKERGLEYLTVAEGRQWFMEELLFGGKSPEVLVFGKLGQNFPLGQLNYYNCEEKKPISNFTGQQFVLDKIQFPLIDQVTHCSDSKIIGNRIINLEKDLHLRDHIVQDNYVFAGVMHVETCCELIQLFLIENKLEHEYNNYTIKEFHFDKFVKVYEGAGLKLNLSAELTDKTNEYLRFEVSVKSDFINQKGILLIKDQIHSHGKITIYKTNKMEKRSENFSHIKDGISRSLKIDLDDFYKKAKSKIDFGPSFQCIDTAGCVSPSEYAGIVTIPDDGIYFSKSIQADTIISPVAVDNIGRFMLFHEFYQNGYSIVPIEMDEIKIYRKLHPGEKIYVYCRYIEEKNKIVTFTCQSVDEDNNLVLDMGKVTMIRIDTYADTSTNH